MRNLFIFNANIIYVERSFSHLNVSIYLLIS
nr:MAG TPA: hypothetical protein [Caudoviricetes sp.]